MDSIETFNETDARVARTLHSPLLNLVIAASILSKITQGKAYLQSPWVPFRPIFGYYPHQPLPSLWYPIDPFIFPSRIYSSLTTNVPQLQPPPLNQQQIIHIHEAPPLTGEGEGYDDSKNKYTQNINNYPQVDVTAPDETDSSSSNLNQQAVADEGEPQSDNNQENYEQIETASSNQDDVYEPLSLVLHDDFEDFDEVNVTDNEIPEPSTPYGKPVERNETAIEKEFEEETTESVITTSTTTIAPEGSFSTEMTSTWPAEVSTTTEVFTTTEEADTIEFNEIEANPQEISNPCILPPELASVYNYDRFDFPNDLQMAEANNVQRRKQRPQNNYDYDYYEDDYAQVQHKRKQRPTAPPRRVQKPRPYKVQPTRINSKRGQYRTTPTPYNMYDDDYDFTTQRLIRREPTRRNSYRKRTTTPSYEFDYYDEIRPKEHRRKTNRFGMRRATTPIQDEYDEDDRYDDNEEEYTTFQRQRVPVKPRQGDEDDDTTTTTTTETTTSTTTEETGGTGEMMMKPTVSYPYYGNNANGNISITYGPPLNNHPGYGPSNGNEHISITYGPPTGQNLSPLLDSWYNQYAKSSVIKRIQELLAPNNFYSPQYEADKYNYNDNVF